MIYIPSLLTCEILQIENGNLTILFVVNILHEKLVTLHFKDNEDRLNWQL